MAFIKQLTDKNRNIQSSPPVVAAFFGDSITHGAFEIFRDGNSVLKDVYDYSSVYHALLGQMLAKVYPAAPLNIINAGISGGNAVQGLERIERDLLPYSPRLAVICFGLNDVHGGIEKIPEYGEALKGIFQKLKARNTETVFMTPNMMNTYVSPRIKDEFISGIAQNTANLQNSGIMDSYMECARKVCTEEKIPVCDCYGKWKKLYEQGVDTTSLLCNHINHPDREMHYLFAASLFETLVFDTGHNA